MELAVAMVLLHDAIVVNLIACCSRKYTKGDPKLVQQLTSTLPSSIPSCPYRLLPFQSKMFINKATALIILGFAATVLAEPRPLQGNVPALSRLPVNSVPAVPAVPALPVFKRDDLVLNAVQSVSANIAPLVDTLSKFCFL